MKPRGNKTYKLHWLDGKIDTVKGTSIADAFTRAGYGAGAMSALDYHKEIKNPLTTYYYELKNRERGGRVSAETNEDAIKAAKRQAYSYRDELVLVYHESDTPDGLPFVSVYTT